MTVMPNDERRTAVGHSGEGHRESERGNESNRGHAFGTNGTRYYLARKRGVILEYRYVVAVAGQVPYSTDLGIELPVPYHLPYILYRPKP